MGCPSAVILENNLKFSICTHDPDTGVLTDASSLPTYRVYEDDTDTAIDSGNMEKIDDANTTGAYRKILECTAVNGYEVDKVYTIYIEATVDGDTGGITFDFTVVSDIPTDMTWIKNVLEGDVKIDITTTPWDLVIYIKDTSTELIRKELKDVHGVNIAAVTTVIGQQLEP